MPKKNFWIAFIVDIIGVFCTNFPLNPSLSEPYKTILFVVGTVLHFVAAIFLVKFYDDYENHKYKGKMHLVYKARAKTFLPCLVIFATTSNIFTDIVDAYNIDTTHFGYKYYLGAVGVICLIGVLVEWFLIKKYIKEEENNTKKS